MEGRPTETPPGGAPRQAGFGKRGQVELSAPSPPAAGQQPGIWSSNGVKYIGGGLVALALLALVGLGSGGSGLIGGLIGGLLGHKLAKQMSPGPAGQATAARQAASSATTTTAPATVQRGGFGTTGGASGSGFFSGG